MHARYWICISHKNDVGLSRWDSLYKKCTTEIEHEVGPNIDLVIKELLTVVLGIYCRINRSTRQMHLATPAATFIYAQNLEPHKNILQPAAGTYCNSYHTQMASTDLKV